MFASFQKRDPMAHHWSSVTACFGIKCGRIQRALDKVPGFVLCHGPDGEESALLVVRVMTRDQDGRGIDDVGLRGTGVNGWTEVVALEDGRRRGASPALQEVVMGDA